MQTVKQLQMLENPMANPQVQEIVKEVNQSGLTAKDLFYKKAKEMGVNPNEIIKQLR